MKPSRTLKAETAARSHRKRLKRYRETQALQAGKAATEPLEAQSPTDTPKATEAITAAPYGAPGISKALH